MRGISMSSWRVSGDQAACTLTLCFRGGQMAEFPALPLWTDAYIADTTHLSDAEHGRYLLMLMHLWRTPNKKFPNDDAWLARKFGRTADEIRRSEEHTSELQSRPHL